MNKKNPSGFTLIELLVVIAIIAVLASFAVPAITSALTKGQLVGSLNNVRQYYLAGYQMALDGNTNADATYNWPGDYNPAVNTLSDYSSRLVTNNYLKVGDLSKLLSGPGAICTIASSSTDATTGVTTVGLGGTPGLKVYRIKDGDSANIYLECHWVDPSTGVFKVHRSLQGTASKLHGIWFLQDVTATPAPL